MQLGVVVHYAAAQVVALGLQGRNVGRSQHQLRVAQAFLLVPNNISNALLLQPSMRVRYTQSKLVEFL